MAYIPEGWADGAAGGTPLQAVRLSYMETGIANAATTADSALTQAQAAASAATANANAITGKADQTALDSLSSTVSTLNQTVTTVQNTTAQTSYVDNAVSGLATTAYVQSQVAGVAPSYANLPAGTQIVVLKAGGTWPVRPTSRTDIVVAWKGADPSPVIGGTGMVSGVDIRYVTP